MVFPVEVKQSVNSIGPYGKGAKNGDLEAVTRSRRTRRSCAVRAAILPAALPTELSPSESRDKGVGQS